MKASNYDHVHEIVNMGIAGIREEQRTMSRTTSNGGKGSGVPLVAGLIGGSKKKLVFLPCSGLVGLENLGNTCFMNSSLQCLSNTIPLTDYFLGYDYRSEINKENFLGTKGAVVSSYAELMKHLWLGSQASYGPRDFKSKIGEFAPQFEGYNQQDAHELLAFLLDGIHEDLNRVKKRPYIEDKDCDGSDDDGDSITAWSNYLQRNRSIIVDLFQGQLRNTMICQNRNRETNGGNECGCGHKNVRFDPFMYLSLSIGDGCQTLDDCLALYCEEELLTGDDMWYCPRCKENVEATKTIDLWMLPPILIIHLKRFKFSAEGHRSKIDRSVDYPLQNWNLKNMKRSRGGSYPLYDLYAVSHHRGQVGHGHYTAQAINRFDGKWYDFNDSKYTPIDPEEEGLGSGPSAYCLFYQRVERTKDENTGEEFKRKTPLIRRQSTNRPELWPHMQRSKAKDWASVRVLDVPEDLLVELQIREETEETEAEEEKKMNSDDAAEPKEMETEKENTEGETREEKTTHDLI